MQLPIIQLVAKFRKLVKEYFITTFQCDSNQVVVYYFASLLVIFKKLTRPYLFPSFQCGFVSPILTPLKELQLLRLLRVLVVARRELPHVARRISWPRPLSLDAAPPPPPRASISPVVVRKERDRVRRRNRHGMNIVRNVLRYC